MTIEPDIRTPGAEVPEEIDWDTIQPTYEVAGARDAVPEMPPIPDVTTLDPPKNCWTWQHDNWEWKAPREELPPPRREVVTEENPIEVDVFYSMRSPYSYLALFRLAYLHSNYNVNVNIRVIFPIAARTRRKKGEAQGGRWYMYGYSVMDMPRTGLYQGVPFRWANPDPILQDIQPQPEASMLVAPPEKQPYIAWLTRLGNAAELEGKALEYCLAVSPLIWGARAPLGEWPLHVADAVNSIGMDYDAVIKDIQANPDKYDAVWQENQNGHQMTGHGGVPLMSYNGEPFFGQDRFNDFFWRLRENGLSVRKIPREPIIGRPLRWPADG